MAASRPAREQKLTRKVPRRREPAAGAPALLGLTSDWYWEQDAELRFTPDLHPTARASGSIIRSAARGLPVRAISTNIKAPFFSIIAQNKYKNIKDLKGAIIGREELLERMKGEIFSPTSPSPNI